jgi:1A family penicillin-binding protein
VIKKFLILLGRPIYKLLELAWQEIRHFGRRLRRFGGSLRKLASRKREKVLLRKERKIIRLPSRATIQSSLYLALSLLILSISGGLAWVYWEIIEPMPNVNQIYNPPSLSSKIYDRNGNLLFRFYDGENRTWISLDKIPKNLILATIAIEDKDFFNHHGLSFKGITKALIYNVKKDDSDRLRGGSTITQQLVKNVFFSSDQSFKRKIREAIMAVLLETKMSKSEILERYFNEVAYGGDTYGVQEAAWKYFGKNAWELDLKESAYLAGLVAAPSSYSPYGSNPELSMYRQKHVLDEMVSAGFVSKEAAEKAKNEEVRLVKNISNIESPHFVFYVKDWLDQRRGFENMGRQGLRIKTSLDLEIQHKVEEIVREEVEKVRKLRITNGAALVIDVKTGDVLAMVGSKDYYSREIDGKFNVTTALRQPGSSIKPINYLLALQRGANLMTVIEDSPVTYQIKGQKPYSPQNYNGKYMGRVTLKTALGSSLNIPSVKLLAQNGVDSMISLAEEMGISSWKDRGRFGLSLALGAGEVKMTDLAQAYSIFANLGKKIEVNPVLEVDNYLGEKVVEKEISSESVIDPGQAYLIDNILSDNGARTPIFGPSSRLRIDGKTVAVKTGTTNSLKDNWCIGWTPSYLVAVWVGNNDGTPMSWVASGVTGATPIWQRIMTEILAAKPDETWQVPANVHKVKVCDKEEYFIKGSENNVSCINNPTPSPASEEIKAD